MECPFCAESVKKEAIVCKHCSRDLRVARPIMLEIHTIVSELDELQRELSGVNARLARARFPIRHLFTDFAFYVLVPVALLVIVHVVVTIVLDVAPFFLRLASFLIPLPFGVALHEIRKIGYRGAIGVGFLTGAVAVACMLVVTGLNDKVPIIPETWVDWREVLEYIVSIALAFGTGNILGFLIFEVFPKTVTHDGRPNALAYLFAGIFGRHVGDDQMRRRARRIQDLWRTAGPLIGILMTASGSIYAGLKGIFGW
jgi:hypothetical protein